MKAFVYFMIFFSHIAAFTQDERIWDKLWKKPGLKKAQIFRQTPDVSSPLYHFDLDGDGKEEKIMVYKFEGKDGLRILSHTGDPIFEREMISTFGAGKIIKLKLVSLSSQIKSLVVYYDEGFSEGKRFESSARIYLATWENLNSISWHQGPRFFIEQEAYREQYWQRLYKVHIKDLNDDGLKDLLIEFKGIQRILISSKNLTWTQL